MCFGFVFLDFMCLGLAEIQVWGSSVDVGFVFPFCYVVWFCLVFICLSVRILCVEDSFGDVLCLI